MLDSMLQEFSWRYVVYAVLGAAVGAIAGAVLLLALLPALPTAEILEIVKKVEGFDRSREELLALEAEWSAAVNAGDAAAVAALFAPDGRIFAPNAPAVVGVEPIRRFVEGMARHSGLALETEPQTVEVAAAADQAFIAGRYRLAFDGEEGRVEDRGKYLLVLHREAGKWRVLVDAFNSDLPAAAGSRVRDIDE